MDLAIANRNFGTDLKQGDFRFFTINPALRRVMYLSPVPLAHLANQLLYRKAKELNDTERFDVVIGARDETDIGVPAIQYIHFPWAYWPRPEVELRWYHVVPLLQAYRKFGEILSAVESFEPA